MIFKKLIMAAIQRNPRSSKKGHYTVTIAHVILRIKNYLTLLISTSLKYAPGLGLAYHNHIACKGLAPDF